MKLVAVSDTHGKHNSITIEECDLLIHAGDFSIRGSIQETKAFLEWFSKQPAEYKIFISGNHDALDYEQPGLFKEILKEYPDVTYLRHEGCEIEGIKIWGRPTVPTYGDWSFMADRGSRLMLSTLSAIPEDTEILVTHGPSAGILDVTSRSESVGCYDLLNELPRLKALKYLICGHIHHSSGTKEVNGITHVNASILNDQYNVTFAPKVLTFNKK